MTGNPVLIIVTGPPGSGKTTLSEKIAEKFRMPLISKDVIKESLLNSLEIKDRESSQKIGISSYSLLYHFLEVLLSAGNSSIAEGNFRPEYASEQFLKLEKKYAFTPLQVLCNANEDILLERYRKRSESGNRHPGHYDHYSYYILEEDLLKGTYKPLDIGGEVVYLDTKDFNKIDYDSLYEKISSLL